MQVQQTHYRTVWLEDTSVFMIEQNLLPFKFSVFEAKDYRQTCEAIRNMTVRGAGAIGAAAGFAMAQAFMIAPEHGFPTFVAKARKEIEATRPTAQNLFYATQRVYDSAILSVSTKTTAIEEAKKIADEDAESCQAIGKFGNDLVKDGAGILTHCNAGWLAFVDHGTALSPIYAASAAGKKVFVYVDETRPRSQGARLTAWELSNENIPHAIVPDNAGAYLMSQGKIDLVITGADRIARNGDVANKIGTLEKAIIAREFNIPFYVAAPSSTIDLACPAGKHIPIEHRSEDEVLYQTGPNADGKMEKIMVGSPGSKAINPAFDVTPVKYISGLITEKGIIYPTPDDNKDFLKLLKSHAHQ